MDDIHMPYKKIVHCISVLERRARIHSCEPNHLTQKHSPQHPRHIVALLQLEMCSGLDSSAIPTLSFTLGYIGESSSLFWITSVLLALLTKGDVTL